MVSGCVVLEALSSRARFICTTVVQIGVAQVPDSGFTGAFLGRVVIHIIPGGTAVPGMLYTWYIQYVVQSGEKRKKRKKPSTKATKG